LFGAGDIYGPLFGALEECTDLRNSDIGRLDQLRMWACVRAALMEDASVCYREQFTKRCIVVIAWGLALGIALAGCSKKEEIGGETEVEGSGNIPVTWSQLPDKSHGWSETDAGFHGERCWKDGAGYRCIQILRFEPLSKNSINVQIYDIPINFYARQATNLEKFKVYFESGYSCKASGDLVEEAITLPNGAAVTNRIDENGKGAWSAKYVRDFFAENAAGSPTVVHFDCLALVTFFKQANEKAFLTTAITEGKVFPKK
jgi:hypothetical protein